MPPKNTSSDLLNIPHHLKGEKFDQFFLQKYDSLIGIDEVGRGCLAGPVITCAISLKKSALNLEGLNDSKKISEKQRQHLTPLILKNIEAISLGIAFPYEIDLINIFQATKLAMKRSLSIFPLIKGSKALLVDGLYLEHSSLDSYKIIKGDAKSPHIMAASIIAKVARDEVMKKYHQQFPLYLWEKNKGYGTKKHLASLKENGFSPLHRKSFSPIKEMFLDFQI